MFEGAQPVVAEFLRSGFVEGHHYGTVAALRADGSVEWTVGDAQRPMLPRSSNKPLQALAMVRLGLALPPELLALACASHVGEEFHIAGVRRILAGAGLDESALQTPPDLPLDVAARDAVLRSGGAPAPIWMNCSGKHAAMLATCVLNGWDVASYRDPEHPLQQAIAETFTEFTGEPTQVAVDGCGAPLLSASAVGLARAFGLLARGVDGSGREHAPARQVAEAIRGFPAYVSGSTESDAFLLAAVPRAIGKCGAEGCYAAALPDGRAWVVKIDDGGERAALVVLVAALRRSGVDRGPGVDVEALTRVVDCPLLGGGVRVGEVRAVL
ncbi:MAG: asparaginase [Nocardioides sp.]|uniref:asparaginase n=1 Tax=Nocardioides sp. TaxID=35761 RepID=UPI0039E4DFF4